MKHALLDLTALALLLAGLARFEDDPREWRALLGIAWLLAFTALAVVEIRHLILIVHANIAQPPLWDFKVFWMVGRAAVQHLDVYDPASFTAFGASLNPGHDPLFDAVALGVGLPYPPPTLYLFYPLGFLGLEDAMRLWYAALFAGVALASGLLWRHFLARAGAPGLLAALLFLLLLPQTAATFALAQVNFFALVLLIAYWREPVAWRAGLWLAPLWMLRPPGLALALEALAARRRALVLPLVAASLGLFALAVPLAGARAMGTYLRSNPSTHYPESFFPGYQSLYQFIALGDASRSGYFSLSAHPLYLVFALVFFAGAGWVALRAAPDRAGMVRAMLLSLGLFVYPSTGAHYAVLLVVPFCELWRSRRELGIGTLGAIVIFELNYALLRVGDAAHTIGLLLVLDSLVFAVLALRKPAG